MKIFIEGEKYPIHLLEKLFDDSKLYNTNGPEGIITHVGYYHSFENNQLIFMLPKVFMRNQNETVLRIDKDELIDIIDDISIKHKKEYNWVRQLSIYFYNSLLEYRRRHYSSSLLRTTTTFELSSNISIKDYSYLDILLSIVSFYKKHKHLILFKHLEFISNHAKKPRWEQTVKKSLPILDSSKTPIYTEISNKKKIINQGEELIIFFISILNRLNKEHHLNLHIDKLFPLIEGVAFDFLCKKGLSKLRKIKHRYFSDNLRRMYTLCELYFSQYDSSKIKVKKEDFIVVSNYNIVFEDMIDKLLSDDLAQHEVNGITIDRLKNNEDGKIIDHIFSYRSLTDTSQIFYIGDSKYYKSDNLAGKLSTYKQFTYAKNVIQFNIDLMNRHGNEKISPLRYRDELTEGYNISPNFFIYGYIDDVTDYDTAAITQKGKPNVSFHYKDRLFDRDTLFVHQYKINFLYALKAYSDFSSNLINNFRENVHCEFRKNFIDYFNNKQECGFVFYQSKLNKKQSADLVNRNYKRLLGKCYRTIDDRLLLAIHTSDKSLGDLLGSFIKIQID